VREWEAKGKLLNKRELRLPGPEIFQMTDNTNIVEWLAVKYQCRET
jgi:hypothetical protein